MSRAGAIALCMSYTVSNVTAALIVTFRHSVIGALVLIAGVLALMIPAFTDYQVDMACGPRVAASPGTAVAVLLGPAL